MMRSRRKIWIVGFAATMAAHPAVAQQSPLAVAGSITERNDSGLAPQGVTVGAFRILPSVSGSVTYDDNVYNRRFPKVSDAYVRLAPRIELRSLWLRHSLSVMVDGEARRYFKRQSENAEQFGVTADGRYDIYSDLQFDATGTIARRVEQRGTAQDVLVDGGPNAYLQKSASAVLTATPGRLLLSVRGSVADYDYMDLNSTRGDAGFRTRDYRNSSQSLRVGYEFSPGIYVFSEGSHNRAAYPNGLSLQRGSTGYSISGGVRFDVSQLIGGEVSLGYIAQNFRSAQFGSVRGLGYSASLFWNPTPLLSIRGMAGRSVQRAPILEAAGIDQNQLSISADYEALRRLMLNARVDHTRSAFRGIDRKENLFVESLTARYYLNRFVDLMAMAELRQQSANIDIRRYTSKSFRIGIIAKY